MISREMMMKVLCGNLKNVFSNGKEGLKKDLLALRIPPRNLFHVYIIISNHTFSFSFNLELICPCESIKKLILHSPKQLMQCQLFEKLTPN